MKKERKRKSFMNLSSSILSIILAIGIIASTSCTQTESKSTESINKREAV